MEENLSTQPEKECKTCKSKPTKQYFKENFWIFLVSFYFLFASFYGTLVLFKKLISLF